jgi:flagellar biosynthesis component FlhA
LAEGLPVKDLVTVCEVAGQAFDNQASPAAAVEESRKALHFLLCSRLIDEEGQLVALALAPDWEEVLREIATDDNLTRESLKKRGEPLVSGVKKKLEEVSPQRVVALITDPGTRRVARKILRASVPRLAVVATDELAPSFKVLVAGSVTRGTNKPHPEGTI